MLQQTEVQVYVHDMLKPEDVKTAQNAVVIFYKHDGAVHAARWNQPVSYTHLTLPTIYSV